MEKTKKYNLRSASSDTQMQAQLGGDMDFVTQLLGVGPGTSSQQGCDSQSSDSELNCSDVINASDSDDTGSRNRSFNKFSQEKSGTSDSHAVDTQTIINQQILVQLTDIGQQLKKLEKPDCKKSNDVTRHKNRSTRTRSESTGQSTVNSAVPGTESLPFNSITVPSLVDIRQNANIQEKVESKNFNNCQTQVLIQKSNPLEAVQLTYSLRIELNGPMSMFWLEISKSVFLMTS